MTNFKNIEAEQTILGTIIMNNSKFSRVEDILEAKHFSDEANKDIFEKIVERLKVGTANEVTLKTFASADNKDYLAKLGLKASLIVDIREYAFVLVEAWRKRVLFEKLNSMKDKLQQGDSLESVLQEFDEAVKEIDSDNESLQVWDGEEISIEWAQFVQKDKMQPIISKLPTLDDALNGGLFPERLYVLGAASGAGKTFFSQTLMLNALMQNLGVLFVSMEMPKKSIFARFFSILSGISSFRLTTNKIFNWELESFHRGLDDWKTLQKRFYITDNSGLTPKNIEAALKKAMRKSPINFVVVDYAQIMRLRDAKNMNEASLIKENVTALADIAKKYKVAMLLLSQLTKANVGGQVGLGSLKGSGGLYEDADCVIAMWADDERQQKNKIKNIKIEVIKNREGSMDSLVVEFDGSKGQFKELKL